MTQTVFEYWLNVQLFYVVHKLYENAEYSPSCLMKSLNLN